MNIAFIKKKYTAYGGAEAFLTNIIIYLSYCEYNVHLITSNWIELRRVNIHEVKSLSLNSFLSNLTFNINAARAVKAIKPDFTISLERTTCQDIYRAGDGCHMEWLEVRSLAEGFLKTLSIKFNPHHRLLLDLEKRVFTKTPIIIANSEMVKSQIIKHYNIPESKIRVVYNGVDLKKFSGENKNIWKDEIRSKYKLPLNSPVVLFLGSGYERKGLANVLYAMRRLDKEVRLLIAGRGDIDKYKAIARKLGILDRVVFAGSVENSEKYYSAADVFVLPTLYDPFSNATLEAMASGIPVITTKNNGACELIENNKQGFVLQDMFDDEELSDRINSLINNADSIGEQASKKAKDFSLSSTASCFLEIIHDVAVAK
ncbi:group 1 glycosyl transferase [Candidatus Magnetoovum chiemensis]|nr:group 1 glycosyl transferase [Candidatus Magnetoovum chiemensis]